ncbi:MAG: ABC transporter permease, partial [Nitrososphaerales archaeon]
SLTFGRKGTIIWDSYEMWVMEILILPLMQMAFFAFLAGYLNYGTSYVQYVVVGNALQVMSFSAVFAVANITSQDKWQGTLPSLIVTPANRMALLVGRAFFQVLMSTLIAVTGLIYAGLVFGVSFSSANFVGIAIAIVLTSLAMISFGLLISAIGLYMRTAMIVANIFLFLTLLVSGVNFPVSTLPLWLQPVSYAIPMTYGVEALRMAVSGGSLLSMLLVLVQELVNGLVVLFIGYLLLIGFERLARSTGRLEEY